MFNNNRKNSISGHKTILENLHVRLVEIKQLTKSRNLPSKPITAFIKNELIRCRADVNAIKLAYKEFPLDNLQNEIESVMNDIEYRLEMYDHAWWHGTLLSGFYPELEKNIEDSTKIVIFAGFEKMEPSDESDLPGLSYGVKLLLKTGEECIHIFNSSGDGCLMSDMANERRKRALNVVTAVVSDLLHATDPFGENFSSLDITIRTDIEIVGFNVPSGWKVQKPSTSLPEVYYGNFRIIPPTYFEHLLVEQLRDTNLINQKIVIFSIDEDLPYQNREFGIKFIHGDEIKTKIVLFETKNEDTAINLSRMNYTIMFMVQFLFEYKSIIQLHSELSELSDLTIMIESDFDTGDLYNPHQFEIIKKVLVQCDQTKEREFSLKDTVKET